MGHFCASSEFHPMVMGCRLHKLSYSIRNQSQIRFNDFLMIWIPCRGAGWQKFFVALRGDGESVLLFVL